MSRDNKNNLQIVDNNDNITLQRNRLGTTFKLAHSDCNERRRRNNKATNILNNESK